MYINLRMRTNYNLIIVGGGPIGIACALEAQKAGLNYLILERGCLVNSLYRYPANMTFFSTSERIEIGAYTTIAGYRSQFMTHAIDVRENRQDAAPIAIGEYCFVGTEVVVLGGARLPDRSVLGAKALLNRAATAPGWLYAGVPARPVKALPADAKYFQRKEGFVS